MLAHGPVPRACPVAGPTGCPRESPGQQRGGSLQPAVRRATVGDLESVSEREAAVDWVVALATLTVAAEAPAAAGRTLGGEAR